MKGIQYQGVFFPSSFPEATYGPGSEMSLRGCWLSVCQQSLQQQGKLSVQILSRRISPRAPKGKTENIFPINHDPVSPKLLNKLVFLHSPSQHTPLVLLFADTSMAVSQNNESVHQMNNYYCPRMQNESSTFLMIFREVSNSTINDNFRMVLS